MKDNRWRCRNSRGVSALLAHAYGRWMARLRRSSRCAKVFEKTARRGFNVGLRRFQNGDTVEHIGVIVQALAKGLAKRLT